jgi:hypothetical protein
MSSGRRETRQRLNDALAKLAKLSDEVNDLRDRFTLPTILGADTVIPLEVHLESIRRGGEKMQEFLKLARER